MKAIIALGIVGWIRKWTWVLYLAAVVAAALAAPSLVPWEVDPSLKPVARVQILYGLYWISAMILLPIGFASLGRQQKDFNYRIFWGAQGVSAPSYFAALSIVGMIASAVLAMVSAIALGIVGAQTLDLRALGQAMILGSTGAFVVAPLILGLTQAIGTAPAAVFGMLINLLGEFGPGLARAARSNPGATAESAAGWEALFVGLPHLHLADQGARLVFGWPPIEPVWFLAAIGYLSAAAGVSAILGYALFKRNP